MLYGRGYSFLNVLMSPIHAEHTYEQVVKKDSKPIGLLIYQTQKWGRIVRGEILHLCMIGNLESMSEDNMSTLHLGHIVSSVRLHLLASLPIKSVRCTLWCTEHWDHTAADGGASRGTKVHRLVEKWFTMGKKFRWFSLQNDNDGRRGQVMNSNRYIGVDPPELHTNSHANGVPQ
eukprot:GHVR01134061.1.p1 GENE.GHVR01134061.1~~GHVR01134061.1.p1  ORF type:complete len:175 (-),score=20.72 GHVR01134061.1:115-639(-)